MYADMEVQRAKNTKNCYKMTRLNGIDTFIYRVVDHSPLRRADKKVETPFEYFKDTVKNAIRSGLFKAKYPEGMHVDKCCKCSALFAKDGSTRTMCSTCEENSRSESEYVTCVNPDCKMVVRRSSIRQSTCLSPECQKIRNKLHNKKIYKDLLCITKRIKLVEGKNV